MNKPTDLRFCIQCCDILSRKIGTFAYHKDKPFAAVSPVFPDLVELYDWFYERNLTSGSLTDLAVYQKEDSNEKL